MAATQCVRAVPSPKTGDKAIANNGDVGWPFGMFAEYQFFGVDAVDERLPTDQYQENGDKIPFLQVVSNIGEHVRKIYWMAHKSVRPTCNQTSKSSTDTENSPYKEKTIKTKS